MRWGEWVPASPVGCVLLGRLDTASSYCTYEWPPTLFTTGNCGQRGAPREEGRELLRTAPAVPELPSSPKQENGLFLRAFAGPSAWRTGI